MKSKNIGIFLYNRLFDPVIQSNFWLYISDFFENNQENYKFYLTTYEDSRFPLTIDQQNLVEQWKTKGLVWIKLKWHPGKGLLLKGIDLLNGLFAVSIMKFKGCNHFISLASVAASYLYLYHILLRFKFYLYQYEPHSEYAIDNKMWVKNSLQFKLTNFLERKAAENAKVISSGTKFMKERLETEWQVKAKFLKIPSVANDSKFLFSQKNREAMRNKLGFSDQTKVLFYPGKFGDLYYELESALMFKWIVEEDCSFHFLIVTPNTNLEVITLMEKANVDPSTYTVAHSGYDEIHHYFAAADFAVISVPPGPSKKFISNIKVGEYLTAGLPFLITEGVSEDYLYATDSKVGVVVKDFKKEHIKKAIPEIQAFLAQDKTKLRIHCRDVGLEYRGFDKLNKTFKQAISSLIE